MGRRASTTPTPSGVSHHRPWFKFHMSEPVPKQRRASDLWIAPFSIGVWTLSFFWMTIVAFASFVLLLVMPFRKFHKHFGAPAFSMCIRFAGCRVTVTRDPGFDPDTRSLFCHNHVNVMDGHLASMVIPHAFCGLMEAAHFKIPGYGWMMRASLGIPVHPRASGRTEELTMAARDRIEKGLSILCFPEAHRTRDGHVRPFRRGVFFMARDAGIPVVPVAIRGMYEVNRRGAWRIYPGRVHVHIGPQIRTLGLDDDAITILAAHMHERVSTFVETGTPFDGPLPQPLKLARDQAPPMDAAPA